MPTERYYVAGKLVPHMPVRLEGQEFHHLAHVTRIRPGEHVELVNGEGTLAKAIVEKVGKKHADLVVSESEQHPKERTELILVQAIPRQNRLDFILEKGTELGVTQFWIFPGQRSERKKLSENQCEHMHSIVIAAMKQCGRLYKPQVVFQPSLEKWEEVSGLVLYGDVDPQAPKLEEVWPQSGKVDQIMVVIGPEGGFAEEEEERLRGFGARGVKLHSNILRTDTAAIAALTLVAQKLL